MANTYIRTERVRTPGSGIQDNLSPPDHDANAVDLLDTIGYICSQIADITGETTWEAAPDDTIVNLAARTNFADKLALRRVDLLTDITVTAAQNWMQLVVASQHVPAGKVKAIAGGQRGLISALHTGTWNTHSLDEVAGSTTISPKNMLLVWNGDTGDEITSDGQRVYALLQHESGATDGTAFTDVTPERCQVSFVRVNATYDDLEACPVADIATTKVNMSWVEREDLDAWTEQDFLQDQTRIDLGAAGQNVTLDNAIDNQGVTPATQTTNTEWRINDDASLTFEDSTGGKTLLGISPAAAGDTIEMNLDDLDINTVNAADFSQGVKVDTAGTTINVGVTSGQIDAGAAALKVASTGAAVTIDGVGVAIVTNAGDLAVNTNDLFVDSSENRIGFQTATPLAPLHMDALTTNAEAIRLDDNTGAPGIFVVDADPNGSITGAKGSIALDYTNGKLHVNTDGSTAWDDLSTGAIESLDIVAQAAQGTDVGTTTGSLTGDVDFRGAVNQINIERESATLATIGLAEAIEVETIGSRNNVSNIIDLDTATNGMQLASDAEVDINATAGVTVDGTTIAITGTDTSSFTMNANDAGAKTLTIEANNAGAGAADILLSADDDVKFTTTEDTALPLTDSTSGSIAAMFGGGLTSVGAAILKAGGLADMGIKVFTAGANYAQDVNVPGAVQSIADYPIDMNTPSTVEQLIFLNGELLVGGNGSTNNDVYVGDTAASGDVKFDFPKGIKTGDIIISVTIPRN